MSAVFAILVVLAALVVAILAHHWAIHPDLAPSEWAFQLSDVQDHETWVVFFAALGVGVWAGSRLARREN